MQPFAMDHRNGAASVIDLSFLLSAPAGKDSFVRVEGGHLVTPDGRRLRLWGVNVTDWSRGSTMLPSVGCPDVGRDPRAPGWCVASTSSICRPHALIGATGGHAAV
jgi:hypothetical protein